MRQEEEGLSCAATIHIAAACDDTYAMPLAVMLRSLMDNLGGDACVVAHIMFDTLSSSNKARLQSSVPTDRMEIRWMPVAQSGQASMPAPIRAYDHISPASYFRLLLADLLPDELDRVIYLDCDLVVLGDIGALWRLDIDDHYAAAVPELSADSRLVSSPQGLRLWRELGLAADLEQFNSGVLLINLKQWREDYILQRAMVYLEQAADWLRWHDQEALNAVFAGNWFRLEARWNLTMRHLMMTDHLGCQSPCIIHYHTAAKPWHADYPFALQETFLDYLDRTAWIGWRPAHTRFAAIRRFGRQLVKALEKRRQLLRRLCKEKFGRIQGMRVLATRLTLLGNPLPERCDACELRIFMIADKYTQQTGALIGQYLASGSDRVILAVDSGEVDAWRTFADAHPRIHLVGKNGQSEDAMLRILLHQYGQGHWCLLARSNEWLRFPHDDQMTLTDLTRFLDNQNCTALMSRRVELLDENGIAIMASQVDGLIGFGEYWLPNEDVRKLRLTERDLIRNHIFVAESYVVPSQLGQATNTAYRSVVSLLKYGQDMLIGQGARSVHGQRLSDIEAVVLQVASPGQTRTLAAIDWRELEAAGLLRASSVPTQSARHALKTDV